MGCKQAVLLSDLIKLQRNYFTFTARVNALLNLVWGSEYVHLYYGGKSKSMLSIGRSVSNDITTCITSKYCCTNIFYSYFPVEKILK